MIVKLQVTESKFNVLLAAIDAEVIKVVDPTANPRVLTAYNPKWHGALPAVKYVDTVNTTTTYSKLPALSQSFRCDTDQEVTSTEVSSLANATWFEGTVTITSNEDDVAVTGTVDQLWPFFELEFVSGTPYELAVVSEVKASMLEAFVTLFAELQATRVDATLLAISEVKADTAAIKLETALISGIGATVTAVNTFLTGTLLTKVNKILSEIADVKTSVDNLMSDPADIL